MRSLSDHYARMVERHPEEPLLVLFDIDGTILDMRHMVRYVLRAYDRAHGTAHFRDLELAGIRAHEDSLEVLLEPYRLPKGTRQSVLRWYLRHRWSREAMLASHRPYAGVMEVIRWFQIQPETFVGLNTGRPGWLRADTLRSLNALGSEYKVRFESELLRMNPLGWRVGVAEAKANAVRVFREEGYRIVAMIDNEPENLRAVGEIDRGGEILLLHADTLFRTQRTSLPPTSVSGRAYDLSSVASRERLPGHVQFVWRGVGTRARLAAFLESNVRWAEIPVGAGTGTGGAVALAGNDPEAGQGEAVRLPEILRAVACHGRALRINLREDGILMDLIRLLAETDIPDRDVWIHAPVDAIGERGFRILAERLPGCLLQCPIDPVAGLIPDYPEQGREILERCRTMGIHRFSLDAGSLRLREVLDRLAEWGLESDVRNVDDLETFLRIVLLLPTSVSATYRFPGWS